jgi:glycosyltransferase involved in cell wall biosynthesis
MRVLHLTTEFPPVIYGGLGTAVGGLVRASAWANLDVAVLLVGETGWKGYDPPQIPLTPHRAEAADCPDAVTLVQVSHADAIDVGVRLAQAWRPDVIHLHVFWLWSLAGAIREQTGTPLVYTVHSLDRAEYELGQGPPECLMQWDTQYVVIAAADRVIALTRGESALLAHYCPAARERVRIVGNGIADIPTTPRALRETGRDSAPLVLYSGRFVERKGIRDLLAAMPLVLDRAPTTRFVLAGGHRHCGGADMERSWLPPDLYPYREHVHFTGWLSPDALADWYGAADVLVVPSWYEPFGMVILEGMLHGLPIVASAVGGPADILEHGRTGLLVPPRDIGALAESILDLVRDPARRRRMGAAAATEVRRTWLWPRLVEKMQIVYHEAIAA